MDWKIFACKLFTKIYYQKMEGKILKYILTYATRLVSFEVKFYFNITEKLLYKNIDFLNYFRMFLCVLMSIRASKRINVLL